MLMLKTTHDLIVAADTKKLGEQVKLISKLTAERDQSRERAEKVFAANLALAVESNTLKARVKALEAAFAAGTVSENSMIDEIMKLRARLAVFTAPRKRDAKGHFLSTKGAVA